MHGKKAMETILFCHVRSARAIRKTGLPSLSLLSQLFYSFPGARPIICQSAKFMQA